MSPMTIGNGRSSARLRSATLSFVLMIPIAAPALVFPGVPMSAKAEVPAVDVKSAPAKSVATNAGKIPFSITVDGQVVDESGKLKPATFGSPADALGADRKRKADVDLSAVDIQVKFDGLEQRTLLNVSTTPIRLAYRAGEPVTFLATSNYPAFIRNSEIRIYSLGSNAPRQPVATIPILLNDQASWTMPDGEESDFAYVLRVYDDKGRFDETEPLTLVRTTRDFKTASGSEAVAPGRAEDRTGVKNIPVFGGAVTVFGRNVPPGYTVEAFNERIPVDEKRAFVVQRILPPGDHRIDVAVKGASKSGGLSFDRAVNIPSNDWFYVGLADLTVGKRIGNDAIETVRSGEYDKIYTKGRAAFYLKGKIRGKYILTAAADTGEDKIENLYRGLDEKDPRQLLRRIDPNDYYPVYGDDSVTVEDAPTSGKFYVRLERGDSEVMWGNYKTSITGTEFLRSNRGLYGARAIYRSEQVTSRGEHRTEAIAYAAQPETLAQRDEFLGTGGSAYFLRRQDITIGSQTLAIEIRDGVTGEVLKRRNLIEGEDYSIDYLQGVILLKKALSSSAQTSDAVRPDALGSNDIFLIAEYEYTPLLQDVDGYIHGGRVQQWIGNRLRIGVTEVNENSSRGDQQSVGADFQLRPTLNSVIEGEFAQSKGLGTKTSISTDGGITNSEKVLRDQAGRGGNAWRLKGQADLADLNIPGLRGSVGAFYEKREAGFSATGIDTAADRQTWSAETRIEVTESTDLNAGYKETSDSDGRRRREGDLSASWQMTAQLRGTAGVSTTDVHSPSAITAGKSGYDGSRVDGGGRIDYEPNDDSRYYAFAQGTLKQSGDIHRNDRVGVGSEYRVTEKISVSGETSYGTHGVGLTGQINYDPTVEDHYYVGYRLDPSRAFDIDTSQDLFGTDTGTITAGAQRKLNEHTSAYAENNFDMFGRRKSLAQAYGVSYTPNDKWTVTGGFEAGQVQDDTIDRITGREKSDFDRKAASMGFTYNDEETGTRGKLRSEARFENSEDNSRDLDTYLLLAGLSLNTSPNWRILTNVDAAISTGETNSYWNGHYLETSVGYAYRPVDNDRWNALFKYTYLRDLPGSDQVSALTGTMSNIEQRSHILSGDVTYDLYPWLSVGGKYGFRVGEILDSDDVDPGWEQSFTQLAVLRADLHFVSKWDVLVEGRVLDSPTAETTDYGSLLALYRHVGDNLKVGVGYNTGRFSDDLRDATLDDQGAFLNVVGKW
ncbi:TonB-dependent receptor [Rhodobacterales bacterium]|nr:TonB-dependent receptor [Rhodobacterales bacterium]